MDCQIGVKIGKFMKKEVFLQKINRRNRGKFVVLEGGLGAGKTTQMELLLERDLSDWNGFREPGGTEFGELMREAVQGIEKNYEVDPYAALFAYVASRAQLMRQVVVPMLNQGCDVLLNRYWYSTYAYQGELGVPKVIIWAINLLATTGVRPNMVLHYDLLPELGIMRKKGEDDVDRYDVAGLEFHKKVRDNYERLARKYGRFWRVIDASKSIEEVYADSVSCLQEAGIV